MTFTTFFTLKNANLVEIYYADSNTFLVLLAPTGRISTVLRGSPQGSTWHFDRLLGNPDAEEFFCYTTLALEWTVKRFPKLYAPSPTGVKTEGTPSMVFMAGLSPLEAEDYVQAFKAAFIS